jgi:hypothetical protein
MDDRMRVATTFKSKTDQDGAVAAALKTSDGLRAFTNAKTKSGRHTLRVNISGKWKCRGAYPYVQLDGTRDSYTFEGLEHRAVNCIHILRWRSSWRIRLE